MRGLLLLITLAYPLLVLAGLKWFDARVLAVLVLVFAAAKVVAARNRLAGSLRRTVLVPALGLLAIMLLVATASDDPRYLFLLPALMNALFLAAFGASLLKPPSVVEIIAHLQVGQLSQEERAYCRAVTGVWCVFFAINGGVIVWLSLRASQTQWALYTGLISYLLMGALFAAEYVYRHYRFRRYLGARTDPLLRKLFPPRETPAREGGTGGPG